jgi:hypothetical protein
MDPMLVEHAHPVSQEANNIDLTSIPATHGDLEDLHRYVGYRAACPGGFAYALSRRWTCSMGRCRA